MAIYIYIYIWHIHTCVYIYIYIYIYTHTHTNIYTYTHTHIYTYIYMYIHTHYIHILYTHTYLSSSSSRHTISMDISDPLSPPLHIIHCFQQVFRVTSCIRTEPLYVGSSWSMWRGPQEYSIYELVSTSPAVSRMSGSLKVFVMDGRWLYSFCFVGCCLHGLFNIARSILV